MAIAYANFQKTEPTFEIDVFDRPRMLTGVEAWTRLLLRLALMEKGTYPSSPNMGCGLTAELYQTVDVIKSTIKNELESQAREYLPDVPLYAINIFTESELVEGGREDVVYYIFAFRENFTDGSIKTVKVASEVKNRVIDFEIKF